VLKPGARHENHRITIATSSHRAQGKGHIYTDHGDQPRRRRCGLFPRGCWHGFNNTSNEDVVLVWGWMDAGSIEDSGYEVHPESHR